MNMYWSDWVSYNLPASVEAQDLQALHIRILEPDIPKEESTSFDPDSK
ncbi:unnamed protein product [Fusarium venenatum]|uniref:Uncharacterized protein n=1 Tax=Fusarium venenatum TaxID=56646 RepID=A0A2L2T6U8_9HYPO|nr:uncharacterized protein FVRRES_03076 [Fusarium venenatum]CEI66564.1 unnamed protein product [Fusarium venenatum]